MIHLFLFSEMQKAFSILLLFIFLLGTANLSVNRHFCGGRVVEVKLAILGDASCGMNENMGMCSFSSCCSNTEGVNRKPCCEDELTQISITDNYKPLFNRELTNLQPQFFALHANSVLSEDKGHTTPVRNYKAPPDRHPVSLSFLQVFLISFLIAFRSRIVRAVAACISQIGVFSFI